MSQPSGSARSWSSRLRTMWPDIVGAAVAILASLGFIALLLRLWDRPLSEPWAYGAEGRDNLFTVQVIQSVLRHGWFFDNPDVGWPAGQNLGDFATYSADNLNFAIIWLLGRGSDDPVVVSNLFFLGGFALVAAAAYASLRWLRFAPVVACAAAVVFAIAPYHVERGGWHLFLGAYYAVPIGASVAVGVLAGRLPTSRRVLGIPVPSLGVLAAGLLVGAAGLYYAVFTIVLVTAASLLVLAARRVPRRVAVAGLVYAAWIGVVLAVNVAPNVLYLLENGSNDAVAQRQPQEAELFGLSITRMLIPVTGHPIAAFDELSREYNGLTPVPSEGGQALGLLMSIGFLAAVGWTLAWASGRSASPGPGPAAAVLATFAALVAAIGGGSSLFAFVVSPQIRAWNRMSIVIGFLAVIVLCAGAQAWWRRRERSGVALALAIVAAACLTLVASRDQLNGMQRVGFDADLPTWREDRLYFRSLEESLGAGTPVLQLPFVSFPEVPPMGAMEGYDHFRGYAHAPKLQWTYGAMRNRTGDWHARLAYLPAHVQASLAAVAGAGAVHLDRWGYVPSNPGTVVEEVPDSIPAADDAAELVDAVARPVSVRASSRYRAWTLDQSAAVDDRTEAAARRDLPAVTLESGFFEAEHDAGDWWQWMGPEAALVVDSPGASVLRMTTGDASPSGSISVLIDGGSAETLVVGPGRSMTVDIPAGRHRIELSASTPAVPGDPRGLHVQFTELWALPSRVDEALREQLGTRRASSARNGRQAA